MPTKPQFLVNPEVVDRWHRVWREAGMTHTALITAGGPVCWPHEVVTRAAARRLPCPVLLRPKQKRSLVFPSSWCDGKGQAPILAKDKIPPAKPATLLTDTVYHVFYQESGQ